jgi:hypothetical protein
LLSYFLILPIILILSSLYDICGIIKNKKSREIKIKSGVKIVNMNKNMMKKVILVLLLIALFSIVLGGCTIIGFVTIPTKGTVYITVDESQRKAFDPVPTYPYHYNIYMDDSYKATIESGETVELYNVLLGYHTFEARDVYYVSCYGSVTQEIFSGVNYVTIPVYTY